MQEKKWPKISGLCEMAHSSPSLIPYDMEPKQKQRYDGLAITEPGDSLCGSPSAVTAAGLARAARADPVTEGESHCVLQRQVRLGGAWETLCGSNGRPATVS